MNAYSCVTCGVFIEPLQSMYPLMDSLTRSYLLASHVHGGMCSLRHCSKSVRASDLSWVGCANGSLSKTTNRSFALKLDFLYLQLRKELSISLY